MENLGAMAYSRYTGFREITDRDVLELHCSWMIQMSGHLQCKLLWRNTKQKHFLLEKLPKLELWPGFIVKGR